VDEVAELEHRLKLPAGELVDAAKEVRICSKSEIQELAGRLQGAAEELASLAWDAFRLQVVHGYAMDLAAANDEQAAFDCTLSCLQEMVSFHTASICMRDEDRILRPKACLGIDKALRRIASFRDGEGYIGTVAKEKQSRISKDFLTEQLEMPPFKDVGVHKHLRSALTVPMLLDNGKTVTEVTPQAIELLMRYDWPGNVRELEHVIHRAVLLTDGSTIEPEALSGVVGGISGGSLPAEWTKGTLEELLDRVEKTYLERMLAESRDNLDEMARRADIHRTTLARKLDKHGLRSAKA